MNGLAWHHMHRLQPEETLKWGEKLKKLSLEEEFPPWLALAKTHVGWARAVLDDLDEGVKELLEGIREWNAAGLVVTTALGYSMVCHAYLQAGKFDKVLEYAQIGLDHIAEVEERHYHSELLRYRGEALSKDPSKSNEAEAAYKESITVAKGQEATALVQRSIESYTGFLEQSGRSGEVSEITAMYKV